MATMEHVCNACGWTDFDNTAGPAVCPKCGRRDISHFWDEEPDREYFDNPDYEEDQNEEDPSDK